MKDEKEIKSVFAKAIAVRTKGPEAKELADRFFLETLVRLHRAGEGEPYTGIKDELVEPIVAMADKALTDGSADEIISKFSEHMSTTIRKKFEDVIETQKNKDKSIKEGRKFVETYVSYMHYIESIHAIIISGDEHHHMNSDESTALGTMKNEEH